MLSSPDYKPVAAIVCTPNHTHVAIGKDLLDAGVHVLCEKPIASDISGGTELVNFAMERETDVKLMIGHHRRFNKYITVTKQLLPRLGRIIAISGLWCLYKPSSYFESPSEWRSSAKWGGPILINLIHEIDILHFLFGPIEHVYAEEVAKQRGYEAEEGAAIVLRFASGAVGTFVLADAVPSPHNFESGTAENPLVPRTGMDFYRIFGTDGSLSVPDMRLWTYAMGKEKSWTEMLVEEQIHVEDTKVPFELQVDHFVRVIKDEEGPVCGGKDGLSALVVCDAIRTAIKGGGKLVQVEPRV